MFSHASRRSRIPEDRAADLEKALKGHKSLGTQLLRTVRQSTILTEAQKLAAGRNAGNDEEAGPPSGKVAKLESDLAAAVGVIQKLQRAVEAREEEDLTPEQIEAKRLQRERDSALARVGEVEGELTKGKRREAVNAILDFAEDDEEGLGFTPKQLEELRTTAVEIIDDASDPDILKAKLLKFAAANRKEQKKVSESNKSDVESLREEIKALTARVSGETTTVTGSTGGEVKSGGDMPFKTLEENWLADPATYGTRYYAERKKLGMEFG
jgi:hypothetical protein